jgi:predicted nucleic acid-binding protein
MASQAIQHGFALITRNLKDFKDVPGLELVPWAVATGR